MAVNTGMSNNRIQVNKIGIFHGMIQKSLGLAFSGSLFRLLIQGNDLKLTA